MTLQRLTIIIESIRSTPGNAFRRKECLARSRVIGIVCLGALLAACGHTPSAQDVPPGATFSANILDNGTKLFTFSTRLPHQPHGGDNTVRRDEERPTDDRPRMHADMAQNNKKGLQAMLLENGYCRDGYVILEMFEERADYVIRGECRDAASDSDRAKYSR